MLTLISQSESDTDQIGRRIAEKITERMVVALTGTLGAGKTRLVQAMGVAWQVDRRNVVSPTFTLCTNHQGLKTFYHIDAYRLVDDDQWNELEFDELIDEGHIVLIEWAEKFAHRLPSDRLSISIEIDSETSRRFLIEGLGPRSRQLEQEIAAAAE